MKDLTHYFVSPPKLRENVDEEVEEILIMENNDDELSLTGETADSTSFNNNERNNSVKVLENIKDQSNKNGKFTPREKRTRVKIRISAKDSNNRRCDIIENGDDVVDKTPSPFNNVNKLNNTNVTRRNERENFREQQTPHNAFNVLMNRRKQSLTSDAETQNECKKKFSQSKVKASNSTDNKAEYSKRKLSELGETETIENGIQKRAKLVGKEEETRDKIKKKKKDARQARVNQRHETVDEEDKGENINDGKKKQHESKAKYNVPLANAASGKVAAIRGDNLAPFVVKERSTPNRNKAKWTMRVKLQSHSDDDKSEEAGAASDDDYIFTPKSKGKYRKTIICNGVSDGEDRETEELGKKGETDVEEPLSPRADVASDEKSERNNPRVQKRRSKKMRYVKEGDDEEKNNDDTIILDEDPAEINDAPKILQEKKLASLFIRRTKPNPAALEARRSFLQSGIPKNVKKISTSEQKASFNDAQGVAMPFPTISHVSQRESDSGKIESEIVKIYKTLFKPKENRNKRVCDPSVDLSQFKSLSDARPKISRKDEGVEIAKIKKENFETVLKEIESRCSDTRTMWKSISSTASNTKLKKSPKRRSKKSKLPKYVDEDVSDVLNPTWTCKYKPTNSGEIVGNETATIKLRNWLNGWRLPSNKDDRSSGDEFYSSDCSNNSYYENNQVAILVGPYGSGKSASVYAIAEELGYRVLEVNASSRRTGKKILTDFQEATKSHRVKRDQRISLPIKKKPSDKKVPQNSLILIEDVDLIFEEDEGFVSATFQLAANTRRPIVMTCKESCSYLHRMAPQLLFIYFHAVSGSRVAALLELIALAESGYRLSKSCLHTLLRNGDLRQSLLQLQYILLSGPPSASQLGTKAASTLWEDMQQFVYKPAIKYGKKCRKESNDVKLLVEKEKSSMNGLSVKLDNISLISSLTDIENPASPPWNKKLNPSLSLFEDFQPYSNSNELSNDISDWLRQVTLKSETEVKINSDYKESGLSMKRKVKLGIDLALSQAIPATLERRSKATDYLPIIRTICRSEQNRASINPKRGNRFHNYLHGLNLASASNNILAAASNVFQEKSS